MAAAAAAAATYDGSEWFMFDRSVPGLRRLPARRLLLPPKRSNEVPKKEMSQEMSECNISFNTSFFTFYYA